VDLAAEIETTTGLRRGENFEENTLTTLGEKGPGISSNRSREAGGEKLFKNQFHSDAKARGSSLIDFKKKGRMGSCGENKTKKVSIAT